MTTRRCIAAVAFIATAALMPVVAAVPADAAAYRYWSYWLGSDTGWTFAHVGPAFRSPADGSIEGWRFSISGVTGDNLPGFSPDFAEVCGDTPAQEDRKRVALVVDPGSAADAMDG
ncbi:MAG: SCO2322 family protein, partial [Candidatus Nanopelagicales bacterium]|nr:SCO2322 family protein [Candidatus Nanopelagicales bacterium]